MIDYFNEQLTTVLDSFETLPEQEFKSLVLRCTAVLKNGGKIIASGLGKNVPICEKFVGTMNSLGMDARFLHTNSAVHGDLGMIYDRDLVLLLSKSGNTDETVDLARHLLERRVEIWLISFGRTSKLASLLDNKLIMDLKHEGDMWDIVPNNSTTVYLILLQGLAISIAKNIGVRLCDFKMNHPGGGIGKKLRGNTNA
jgi:arabinose-5-phosphate isomerase